MSTTAVEKKAPSQNGVAKHQETNAERFTNKVMHEFKGSAGEINLSDSQKRLVQNYFISIDMALKSAEEKRMKKSEQYREPLAYDWKNVNIPLLAVRVVAFARIGLDPAQPNHVNAIPYKNNNTNLYDITFIEGYRGKELKAVKYGLNVPDGVIVELVYKTDTFIPKKKDMNNSVESYIFEVVNPWERGEVVGGFYYHQFKENPEKNKLVFYSIAELEKRKPQYASAEFWGGEKDVWSTNAEGKREKVKEQTEGWRTEMLWKTVFRAAYNSITIDSQKIDDNYMALLENEKTLTEISSKQIIQENANKTEMGFDEAEVISETKELNPAPVQQTIPEKPVAEPQAAQPGEQTKAPFA